MTEKQKYYRLLSMVCEDLPIGAINQAIASGYDVTATRLMHVRQGRINHLGHLVKLIELGLPKFHIPAELLPAPAPVTLLD